MLDQLLGTRQKALKINLSGKIYGSFAEIGAGQEVASLFFKAGGASGTIAKTISAYDMTFSDAIYGVEETGRYVCESRLVKMLNREYNLVEMRLGEKRGAETTFFAFANTVTTINFKKNNESHGWVGLRFQLRPEGPYNDAIIHVRMLDKTPLQQQQVLGIVGVNLLYGCFYYPHSPETLLKSLMDELSPENLEIDMVRISGPDFAHVDNRLLSLQLVKNGFTDAALFGPDGNVLQASEYLYKKNILALRGRFRPLTKVHVDMLEKAQEQFLRDPDVDADRLVVLSELTLHNLRTGAEIDEQDFLDRVDIICSLGHTVLISDYEEYYKLVAYFSRISKQKIGIILGVNNLEYIFEDHYKDLPGGILESFAALFSRKVKMLVYPMLDAPTGIIKTCQTFTLPPHQMDLYEYLLANDKLEDITGVNPALLPILSDDVIAMIKAGRAGWETGVPPAVAQMIKDRALFGYGSNVAPPPLTPATTLPPVS